MEHAAAGSTDRMPHSGSGRALTDVMSRADDFVLGVDAMLRAEAEAGAEARAGLLARRAW